MKNWISADWTSVGMVLVSVLLVYSLIILYTRLAGLRSFSKMSAPDFAMTVAVGSLLGSAVVSPSPSVLIAATALGGLFFCQWAIAWLRVKTRAVGIALDNQPILLMRGSAMLETNMRRAKITTADLHGKLREANVWSYQQIIAVVFEATGDVSVIHRNLDDDPDVDHAIFEGVIGVDAFPSVDGR